MPDESHDESPISSRVLTPSPEPVVPGLEAFEAGYAKNQPEYRPLRVLQSMKDAGQIMTRWTLTSEQRLAVFFGADIYLEVMTFHRPLQPLLITVGAPDVDAVIDAYGLAPGDANPDPA